MLAGERRDEDWPADRTGRIRAVQRVEKRRSPPVVAVGDELVQPEDEGAEAEADDEDSEQERGPDESDRDDHQPEAHDRRGDHHGDAAGELLE